MQSTNIRKVAAVEDEPTGHRMFIYRTRCAQVPHFGPVIQLLRNACLLTLRAPHPSPTHHLIWPRPVGGKDRQAS